MRIICQNILPISPWDNAATARLPGIQPLKDKTLFIVDDAFEQQMEYRDHLIKEMRLKGEVGYICNFKNFLEHPHEVEY